VKTLKDLNLVKLPAYVSPALVAAYKGNAELTINMRFPPSLLIKDLKQMAIEWVKYCDVKREEFKGYPAEIMYMNWQDCIEQMFKLTKEDLK